MELNSYNALSLTFPGDLPERWILREDLCVTLSPGDFNAEEAFQYIQQHRPPKRVRLNVFDARYIKEAHAAFGAVTIDITVGCDMPQLDWPALQIVRFGSYEPKHAHWLARPPRIVAFDDDKFPDPLPLEEVRVSDLTRTAALFVRACRASRCAAVNARAEIVELPRLWAANFQVVATPIFAHMRNLRELSVYSCTPELASYLQSPDALPMLCVVDMVIFDGDSMPSVAVAALLRRELRYLRTPVVKTDFDTVHAALAESKCQDVDVHYKTQKVEVVLGWIDAMARNTHTHSTVYPAHCVLMPMKRIHAALKRYLETNKTLRSFTWAPDMALPRANRTLCYFGYRKTINASLDFFGGRAWRRAAVLIAWMRSNRAHTFRDVVFRPDCLLAIEAFCVDPTTDTAQGHYDAINAYNYQQRLHKNEVPSPSTWQNYKQYQLGMPINDSVPAVRLADTRFVQNEARRLQPAAMAVEQPASQLKRKHEQMQ